MIRRSHTQSFGAGLWELPGGKITQGSSNAHTQFEAARELVEETGITIPDEELVVMPVDALGVQLPKAVYDTDRTVTPKIYRAVLQVEELPPPTLSSEHDKYQYVGLSRLTERPNMRGTITSALSGLNAQVLFCRQATEPGLCVLAQEWEADVQLPLTEIAANSWRQYLNAYLANKFDL